MTDYEEVVRLRGRLGGLMRELSTLRTEQTRLEEKWRRQQQVIGDYQAEQARLREALAGLLTELPELWGDNVRNGKLTLLVSEEHVFAALSSTPTPEHSK